MLSCKGLLPYSSPHDIATQLAGRRPLFSCLLFPALVLPNRTINVLRHNRLGLVFMGQYDPSIFPIVQSTQAFASLCSCGGILVYWLTRWESRGRVIAWARVVELTIMPCVAGEDNVWNVNQEEKTADERAIHVHEVGEVETLAIATVSPGQCYKRHESDVQPGTVLVQVQVQ
jgi:hypothetical protein